MKILITGSNGFIGKNLCAHLKANALGELLEYDRQSPPELLAQYAACCDFVFHLAGVNRPISDSEFEGNHQFTHELLELLRRRTTHPPVLMSSSMQAQLDNPYGRSKRKAEELVLEYGRETAADVYLFRLPGVFGKWCAPNYNSVVATFCHNLAHGLPVHIENPDTALPLVYIDDVLQAFTAALQGKLGGGFCEVTPVYHTTVGELANTIQGFVSGRQTLVLPDMNNPLTSRLYSTYLSYLPEAAFSYVLREHRDERGAFAECMKALAGGQVSVNVTKPGMTKGGHWHHTKTEKFLVVSGAGMLRFQRLGQAKVLLYPVSCEKLEIVDVPPGYIHDLTNTGSTDMVMLIWASEIFDPQNPDTYPGTLNHIVAEEAD